jgi:hypothetical protein
MPLRNSAKQYLACKESMDSMNSSRMVSRRLRIHPTTQLAVLLFIAIEQVT